MPGKISLLQCSTYLIAWLATSIQWVGREEGGIYAHSAASISRESGPSRQLGSLCLSGARAKPIASPGGVGGRASFSIVYLFYGQRLALSSQPTARAGCGV